MFSPDLQLQALSPWRSLFDVLLVAAIIYQLLLLMKGSRSGAALFGIQQRYGAVVVLDNLFDQREPKADPIRFRAVKRVENLVTDVLRNAGPIVGDCNPNPVSTAPRRYRNDTAFFFAKTGFDRLMGVL